AESEHHAELFRIDPHGEAEKADQRYRRHGDHHGKRAAHAPARDSLADAVLASAQNFLKVRLLISTPGPRPPRPPGPALPTAAAALIAPRHGGILLSLKNGARPLGDQTLTTHDYQQEDGSHASGFLWVIG